MLYKNNLLNLKMLYSMASLSAVFLAGHPAMSVRFLDAEPDNLTFLSSKYPQYAKRAKELPESNSNPSAPSNFLETAQTVSELTVYDPVLFQKNKKAAREVQQFERKELEEMCKRTHLGTIFDEFIFKRKTDPECTILEDVALAAHQIEDVLIREGSAPVIFLGRTPCLVQVAYEELCQQKYSTMNVQDHIIHLSFSGTPDTLNLRASPAYQDQEEHILRSFVTPEKLSFYEDYLTQKGLRKADKKLYVVDMMGTGASLNSFLRLLRHYYHSNQQELPEVHFICLSLSMGGDHQHPLKVWKFEQKPQNLTFTSMPNHGIRPLQVKTTPLQLSEKTLGFFLDNDAFQQVAVHGIEFPAQKWRKEFEPQLQQGGSFYQKAYAMFRPKLKEFVANHEQALQEERAKLID